MNIRLHDRIALVVGAVFAIGAVLAVAYAVTRVGTSDWAAVVGALMTFL